MTDGESLDTYCRSNRCPDRTDRTRAWRFPGPTGTFAPHELVNRTDAASPSPATTPSSGSNSRWLGTPPRSDAAQRDTRERMPVAGWCPNCARSRLGAAHGHSPARLRRTLTVECRQLPNRLYPVRRTGDVLPVEAGARPVPAERRSHLLRGISLAVAAPTWREVLPDGPCSPNQRPPRSNSARTRRHSAQ